MVFILYMVYSLYMEYTLYMKYTLYIVYTVYNGTLLATKVFASLSSCNTAKSRSSSRSIYHTLELIAYTFCNQKHCVVCTGHPPPHHTHHTGPPASYFLNPIIMRPAYLQPLFVALLDMDFTSTFFQQR